MNQLERAAFRRDLILSYLAFGPRTSHEVADYWTRYVYVQSGGLKRVTIDTIQRDLNLLVERGLLRRSKGKGREWGDARNKGHEYGKERWIWYDEYEVMEDTNDSAN